MHENQKSVEILTKEASPLDAVIEATEKSLPRKNVVKLPAGYQSLSAGVVRKIRVNRDWIVSDIGKQFIVSDGSTDKQYKDVIVLGQSIMKCSSTQRGCGFERSAWVETDSELHVSP